MVLSLALFIASCIDPIDTEVDREVNILIVEGAITTGPGPHKIRLSRSAQYGGIVVGSSIRPVIKASVFIRDSHGNRVTLTEEIFSFFDPPSNRIISHNTGVYSTANEFSAVVGNNYTLFITTANGIEYTSLPEKIIPATEILELSAEFKKVPAANNEFITGFDVYATFQDPLEEQNFYMWKNTGTYKIITFPALHLIFTLFGPAIADPKDCCRECWVTESSADRSLQIRSDNDVNGNLVTDRAAFIEDDGLRFTDKYLVRIELQTLNREAFQFFQLLNEQLSINGDIFDSPPATIRGNMINLTNPDENVIGYFRASDTSIDSMFLTRDMLLEAKPLLDINDDCQEYEGGITAKPSYW